MKKLISILTLSLAMYAQVPDAPTVYPEGELGRMVKLGEDIIMNTNTHELTKDYVGNSLKCTSCHLDGGKTKNIGTFIGTATAFPAFSGREKTVQSLQDRINNCFMRSMNGKRPIVDTEASIAMATYITWLSDGLPMKMNPKKPVNPFYTKSWPGTQEVKPLLVKATHENYLNGEKLFNSKCASCHGMDGQGIATFPPVWGSKSYNTGAGLSKLDKMTTWLKGNMPFGNPDLTLQEAVDITIFVDAQERDDFNLQNHLLPREKMGYYNSKVEKEIHSVKSNFKAFGLDLEKIKTGK